MSEFMQRKFDKLKHEDQERAEKNQTEQIKSEDLQRRILEIISNTHNKNKELVTY